MRERPLALTDGQIALLKRIAASVPIAQRDAFLREVARRLGEGQPATCAVEVAISSALGGSAPVLEEESA
jgi:hypothetical protein